MLYHVIFSENGYIRHSCWQEARNELEAIERARMYTGLNKCPARVAHDDDDDERETDE